MTTQEFIDAIKGMTVLELNELVKACEEEFGVSAAAGVVVAAAGPAAAAEEEKTEFDVELTTLTPVWVPEPARLSPLFRRVCTSSFQQAVRFKRLPSAISATWVQ